MTEFDLGSIKVKVVQKDIKNIHLSVNPPFGEVRISAPERMSLDAIRSFTLTKLSWIKDEQKKMQLQEREIPREFLEMESHFVWGQRYLLKIEESPETSKVLISSSELILKVRPGYSKAKMRLLLEEWYREQIKQEMPKLIEKWAPLLGVKVDKLYVQQMKTKWGGCCPDSSSVRLNTELAKKPIEFLEYVLVHELIHLVERTHSNRFFEILDSCIPNWRHLRDELNRLPVPHGAWH